MGGGGFGGGFALTGLGDGRGLVLVGGREVDGGGDGGVGKRSICREGDVWIGVSGLRGRGMVDRGEGIGRSGRGLGMGNFLGLGGGLGVYRFLVSSHWRRGRG